MENQKSKFELNHDFESCVLYENVLLNTPDPWLVKKCIHVGSIWFTNLMKIQISENLNLKLISNN